MMITKASTAALRGVLAARSQGVFVPSLAIFADTMTRTISNSPVVSSERKMYKAPIDYRNKAPIDYLIEAHARNMKSASGSRHISSAGDTSTMIGERTIIDRISAPGTTRRRVRKVAIDDLEEARSKHLQGQGNNEAN